MARLTADHFDAKALQRIASPSEGARWGSLKSLEKVLATIISEDAAHRLMSPLFAIYELRLADAHLTSQEVAAALKALRIAGNEAPIDQGYKMLDACVGTIYAVCKVLSPPTADAKR